MAKKKVKPAPRKRKRKSSPVHLSIRNIISFLTYKLSQNQLCPTGKTKLEWWKRNGSKFKDAKAALLSWPDDQIEEWLSYADLDGNFASSLSDPYELILRDSDGDEQNPKGFSADIRKKFLALEKLIKAVKSDFREEVESAHLKDLVPEGTGWAPETE